MPTDLRNEALRPLGVHVRHDVAAPNDWLERFLAGFLRLFLRATFRPFIGPRLGPSAQRGWTRVLALLMPGRFGLVNRIEKIAGLEVLILSRRRADARGVVLYLHGGAFCLGGWQTHRGMCSHIAHESGMPVWIPNYRLAPEHPYPCALDDALAMYDALLQRGYANSEIVVAGDSAGGSLALALAIRLKRLECAAPAALALISPVTDLTAKRDSTMSGVRGDPMVTQGWLSQGVQWFNVPQAVTEFSPLHTDLNGLPPMHIQAGNEEILLTDSLQLEAHARRCNVPCRLDIYKERWHVFHLQAFYLRSSRQALKAIATFARESIH